MQWDDDLLDRQKEAARHTGGHARLLAAPGTGKTRVLTRRVLYLVTVEEVDPDSIVALTFTRAAAAELWKRVHEALEGRVAAYPWISTLHSFALRNLLRNANRIDALPRPLRIADDWEEEEIINPDMKRILGMERINDVRDHFERLGADWSTLQVDREASQADPSFVGAWRQHRTVFGYTLRSELLYQLSHALEQVSDFELSPFPRYLLVDEFQDLNRCDLAVIEKVVAKGAEVYGAGDDDQSIYGFRYAHPDGIRRFGDFFSPFEPIDLDVCVRCDRSIIRLAKFVAELDPNRAEKPFDPREDAGEGEVRLLYFSDQVAEARGVASICRYLIDQRHPEDEILVLIRSDRYRHFSNAFMEALSEAGVLAAANTDQVSPIDTNHGREFISLLRLCLDRNDPLAWRTLLGVRKNGIGPGSLEGLYDVAVSKGWGFGYAVREAANNDGLVKGRARSSLRSEIEQIDSLSGTVCGFFASPDNPEEQSPFEERLCDAYSAIYGPDGNEELVEFLATVVEEGNVLDLEEFLQMISAAGATPEQDRVAGAVNILTMHRAKGLTANTVFLAVAEDEYLPGRQEGEKEGDELRLLYVSLSRARNNLFITYCTKRTGPQRHLGRVNPNPFRRSRRTLTRFLRDAPLDAEDGDAFVRSLS